MARSGIVYGSTGSFKTTAVKHFSHYIYEVTGKKTLLLSMDGGGWEACVPEVMDGIITPYRCTTEIPLPVLRKISQGYWPEDAEETEPSKINLLPIDWGEFGGVAVEGLTSVSQALMRHLSDKGILTGGEKSIPNRLDLQVRVSGQVVRETFGSSTQGHYGFTQNVIYSTVMSMIGLPCNYVLFTALESKTEEDDRTIVMGPMIAGKKATALVPSWVGDCIHYQDYSVEIVTKTPNVKGEMEDSVTMGTMVKGYFVKHPDPVTGIPFPAKPRVTPEKVKELLKHYPGGFFVPNENEGFDKYLHTIDKLQLGQVDAVRAWREQVDARRKAMQAKG